MYLQFRGSIFSTFTCWDNGFSFDNKSWHHRTVHGASLLGATYMFAVFACLPKAVTSSLHHPGLPLVGYLRAWVTAANGKTKKCLLPWFFRFHPSTMNLPFSPFCAFRFCFSQPIIIVRQFFLLFQQSSFVNAKLFHVTVLPLSTLIRNPCKNLNIYTVE